MRTIAIDVETSTYNNGNPFDARNKLVCFSWATEGDAGATKATPDNLKEFAERLTNYDIFVFFNGKFDIHWLRKVGVRLPENGRVFDTQIGEFILSNQSWRYPNLDESATKRGLGQKINVIAEQYWANGIQTEDIPWPELAMYAEQDSLLTLKLYRAQMELMSAAQKQLCMLQGMDLLVLEEMEWNGIKFDEQLAEERAKDIENEIQSITNELSRIYPDVPINFNSGDHLSAFLYGGTIVQEVKEHIGFFKSGAKIGQPRYKNHEVEHELPRLFTPIRGSELKKEGFYATNADTLLKLKGNRKTRDILESIQRQIRLQSLLSKSYNGISKSNREGNWEPGYLHGQFNQCVAQTGRLSSSNPNLQNFDSEAQDLFVSRFDD